MAQLNEPTLQIIPLRKYPARAADAHTLIRDYFWDLPFCHNSIDETAAATGPLPHGWLLLKDGSAVGWIGLIVNDPIETAEYTPVIGPLVIAEPERNNGYGALLLYHARNEAAKLGYENVYLTSQHIGYYERFGFREIAMTSYTGGKPTKIYIAKTIH
jgi:GNAT superfamily N-acetyltransferase